MVEKLGLPFPFLSDPDRSKAIGPYGLADPKDHRDLAVPALVLIAPGGEEVWRFVSRDYADRLPEDDVVEIARAQGWPPTTQDPPERGRPEPGPRAMPIEAMIPYFRGARFAALAMGLRHGHLDESVKDDSKAYVEEMDRFIEAVRRLRG
jgi:hypothetical protein